MRIRRLVNCAECARTGGHSDAGDLVWCFRLRQLVSADGTCQHGIPIRSSSTRLYVKGK